MVVAKEGFESVFQNLTEEKAKLLAEKETAINAACEEVNAKFAEREALIDEILAKVSVDIPEPVEVVTEPEVTQEAVEVNVAAVEQPFETNSIFDEE